MNIPTPTERLGYYAGRTLPEPLQEWVRHDLAGPGSECRLLTRCFVLMIPLLSLVLLIPGDFVLLLAALVMMLVPFIVFTIGLSYAYRRFRRLVQHGLSPELVDRAKHTAVERQRYAATFGSR